MTRFDTHTPKQITYSGSIFAFSIRSVRRSKLKRSPKRTSLAYQNVLGLYQDLYLQRSPSQTFGLYIPCTSSALLFNRQVKKMQDRVQKTKEEVQKAKEKYEAALQEINQYNPKYMEDMTQVFEKCQEMEAQRLQFFKDVLFGIHKCLNISQDPM